jgi:pyruvate formate-lyase/glycerol dehydratase family glycyl radical enzyme
MENSFKNIDFIMTQRVKKLREKIVNSKPEICSERAVLVTDIYKMTEGEPIVVRRAKALLYILKNMTIFVNDGELIVGNQTSKHRSAPVFPEMDVSWLERELDTLETREVDPFIISDKAKQDIRGVFSYWKGQTLREHLFAHLPEETKLLRERAKVFSITVHEESGLGHVLLDYERILNQGFSGVKSEIEKCMNTLDFSKTADIEKYHFLKAFSISCDAAIAFAERYSKLAYEMSLTETGERKDELLKISEVCARVPQYPARTFHEALQSFWFIQLIPQIETNSNSYSPGRFDQYLYKFLKQDIENKILTWQEAMELLNCLWIKFNEPLLLFKKESAEITGAFPMGQNLLVGGQNALGEDVTNELSYLCLKAQAHIRFGQPNFSIRVHKNTPGEFLEETCKVISIGTGMPQVFNDEVIIPSLLTRGFNIGQAREYAEVGCVENAVLGTWARENGGYLNLLKILELALTNGKCLLSGEEIGLKTGEVSEIKSFEELMNIYQKQLNYYIKHLVIENIMVDYSHAAKAPVPFVSVLVPGCIQRAKDVTNGGANYNFTCPTAVGVANVADSLAAIKKVVFDDKKIALTQLVEALKNNYDSADEIRNLLLDAPKYGNDLDYVDTIARDVANMYMDEIVKYQDFRGGKFQPGFTAVTANISLGHDVGASPEGRKARVPLAEGISPVSGREKKGPTAVMKSVTKLDIVKMTNGHILNIKLHSNLFKNNDGITALKSLIKGYHALGGMHIQFNTISAKVLKNAQINPQEYKDLVIRVAGYSAFFVELSKEVQNTIIRRTEHII